jgi:hypothetical protein
MNDELSNKIIGRIDAEKIAPRPRWYFVSLRVIFWIFAVLSIIVGSLAVGAMIFLFADYYNHGLPIIPHDLTELLLLIPYVWLIIFALFIVIGHESIKHTPKGYRYRLYAIVSVCVFLSFVFGSIFNFAGGGKTVHEFFNNNVPFYNVATYDSKDAWNRPVIGRLAGIIVSIQNKNNFSIIDFNGQVWHVRLATTTNGSFVPEASSTIRMFGMLEASSSTFIAKSVYEWEE